MAAPREAHNERRPVPLTAKAARYPAVLLPTSLQAVHMTHWPLNGTSHEHVVVRKA